jgi:hypothetical protein
MSKTLFNLKDHSSQDLYNLQVLVKTGMEKAKETKVDALVEDGERWTRLLQAAEQEAIKRETDQTVKDSINKTLGY